MPHRFGVTRSFFIYLARLGFPVGLFLGFIFVVAGTVGSFEHGWNTTLLLAGAMIAMPILACLLAGVCVAAFSVHVTNVSVKQMLFDRFELSEFPARDFVEIIEERSEISFTNRRRMRLAGMHPAELRRLANCIQEQLTLVQANKDRPH